MLQRKQEDHFMLDASDNRDEYKLGPILVAGVFFMWAILAIFGDGGRFGSEPSPVYDENGCRGIPRVGYVCDQK